MGIRGLGSELPPFDCLVGAEFHHVGFAGTRIEHEIDFFSLLGYRPEGPEFIDPEQGIRGIFLVGDGPRIELLENTPGSETLTPWLKAGSRIYHLAFTVPDIHQAIEVAHGAGAILLRKPAPSVAFQGRLISFVKFRIRLVVEFIDNADAG